MSNGQSRTVGRAIAGAAALVLFAGAAVAEPIAGPALVDGDNLLIGDAVAQTPPQSLQIIYGNAVVVDGDTLRMGDVHLRLLGIDAPEADQTCAAAGGGIWRCGEAATAALKELAAAGVWCGWQTVDQYGQGLATCITRGANSIYINEWMVETGNAWTYLMDEYTAAEGSARAAGFGVWQAPNQTAAEYRRARDAAILDN